MVEDTLASKWIMDGLIGPEPPLNRIPKLACEATSSDVLIHKEVLIDITDSKAAEAEIRALADRLMFLNQLSNQISNSFDLEVIVDYALDAVRTFLGVDACALAWLSSESELLCWDVIQESKREGLPSSIGTYPGDRVGPVGDVLSENFILKIDDVSQYSEPIHQKFLDTIHCKSELLIPIKTRSQRIGVLISMHFLSQHTWTDREVEFLQSVCSQISIAISQADLYQKSCAKSDQLSQMLIELKQTQSQVIQSEKMSSLGQLVAGIAHEINNPVNFIHGNVIHTHHYTQDLLELVAQYQTAYPTPPDTIAQYMEDIDLEFLQADLPKMLQSMQTGTERIREIVKSLRLFSRLDEAELKCINIHEGLDSTLLILQSRIQETLIRGRIVIQKNYGEILWVECLAGQLNQVFMNIIVNAIDALEERDHYRSLEEQKVSPSCITITTSLGIDRQTCISIHDNGPGIPDAIQPLIFDPFFTTKEVGKGTGLGMSISYQIITEKHGGTLTLQSTPETGTTFTIMIPSHSSAE